MAYGRRTSWTRRSPGRSAGARGRGTYSRSGSSRRTGARRTGRRTATRSGRQEIVLRIEGVPASGVSRPSINPVPGVPLTGPKKAKL